MSQGQSGKLRAANDHSKKEARGLSSSTNDVEMMANHAEKDQPMDVSVVCPAPAEQKSEVSVMCTTTTITTNHCMDHDNTNECKSQMQSPKSADETTVEDQLTSSPDLVKTLKTVQALKKTFRDTFINQAEEIVEEEQTKKTNLQTDNVIGKEVEVEAKSATAPPTSAQTAAASTPISRPQSHPEEQRPHDPVPVKLPEKEMSSVADSKESGEDSKLLQLP